jgi:Helix-turn-helix domain
MAAFPELLRKDRERRGFTVGQVAWRLDVKPQKYRELEAGERFPDFETWDRICKLYGWPQTLLGPTRLRFTRPTGSVAVESILRCGTTGRESRMAYAGMFRDFRPPVYARALALRHTYAGWTAAAGPVSSKRQSRAPEEEVSR